MKPKYRLRRNFHPAVLASAIALQCKLDELVELAKQVGKQVVITKRDEPIDLGDEIVANGSGI